MLQSPSVVQPLPGEGWQFIHPNSALHQLLRGWKITWGFLKAPGLQRAFV